MSEESFGEKRGDVSADSDQTQNARSVNSTSALNVELLRKIQAHITEEPKRFDLGAWIDPSTEAPCGTVACVAGWAIKLSGIDLDSGERPDWDRDELLGHYSAPAAKVLGLANREQSESLFLSWPPKYADAYWFTQDRAERARIACERIEHFIETGE